MSYIFFYSLLLAIISSLYAGRSSIPYKLILAITSIPCLLRCLGFSDAVLPSRSVISKLRNRGVLRNLRLRSGSVKLGSGNIKLRNVIIRAGNSIIRPGNFSLRYNSVISSSKSLTRS